MSKDVMLPIRMPSELKDLFQILCKSRNATASSEIRRLMAEEVASAAMDISLANTRSPKRKAPLPKKPTNSIQPKVENRGSSRCDDTGDLFDESSEKPSHERVTLSNYNNMVLPQKEVISMSGVKIELSSTAKSAINASSARNKTKTRKQ